MGHELDSPNMGGHLPHSCCNLTFCARKWAVVRKDNRTPYQVYLLSDLRTSLPLKRRHPSQIGLRRFSRETFRPPGTASLGVRGLIYSLKSL
ncbi:hypothetical protein AVEN_16191-1 [Araneus ventricosus]|uniref:Uncharacterized protein n=1 Tax=Araneus ventricosus TaxID=182803 RepID=A0A4Y2IWS1_ARAVE|nr:hypothetical protein AVEN_16191-1 [Araneus ventricosus]